MTRRSLFILLAFTVLLGGCRTTPSAPATPAPIVILISLDGVRWDYPERFDVPALRRLAADGVRAERLRPSFPTLTFPNHYTLVTGLVPGHHGIIANQFIDPETQLVFNYGAPRPAADPFWGGEPIWVTAERQGLAAACMFWPGSEAEIGGFRPRYWVPYDHARPIADRVRQVLTWLALPEAERPRVITLYFHHADSAGHTFGVESEPLREAMTAIDGALADLRAGVERLALTDRVHFIVTSDHGMSPIDQERVRAIDDWVVPDRDARVSFYGAVTGLWPIAPQTTETVLASLQTLPPDFRAYRREDLPSRWHLAHQARISPVVIVAQPGAKLAPRSVLQNPARGLEAAAHGYDETVPDLGALFLAWGPRFRSGERIPEVENVHVYALLCATLGIDPAPNDGNDRLARAVLRTP